MERPAAEVIQYYDHPDPLVADELVGDVRADQPTPAGNQNCFVA
jgi:hypothetical protein